MYIHCNICLQTIEKIKSNPIVLPSEKEFDIYPMKNSEEYRLKKIKQFSMNTNKALNCKWHNYVSNVEYRNWQRSNAVTFPKHAYVYQV